MPSTIFQLRTIENHACNAFAVHLATCDRCLSDAHRKRDYSALCPEGKRLRDNHIEAARELGEHEHEFARRYPSLVA